MPFAKTITAPNGASTGYHRLLRIECDADSAVCEIQSWPTENDYIAKKAPTWTWFPRVQAPAGFVASIESALMAAGDFAGAAQVEDSADTLDSAKARARAKMAQAWNAEHAAGVTVGGKVAPSDSEAWTRYLVIRQMAEEAGWTDVPIQLKDGTFELLTLAKSQALWAALKGMERTLLAKLRDRCQQINAAATIAEVEAVAWNP